HVLVCRQSPTLYEVRNLACNLLSTPASSTSNPHAMHRPESRATARRSTRSPTVEPAVEAGRLFDAGSRTGRLMRSRDWSATALGPVQEWPDNLKAPLRLMLASSQPAFIWWGPELVHLHNDGCARLFGRRRPFGKPAAQIREEIGDAIGADVCAVLDTNAATLVKERRVIVARNGHGRELYCTFSLTPIRDEWGSAVGVFGTGADETAAVLARRRLAALSNLHDIVKVDSLRAACEWSAAALASDVCDVPCALLYLVNESGRASLAGSAGAVPDAVETAFRRGARTAPWPLEPVPPGES